MIRRAVVLLLVLVVPSVAHAEVDFRFPGSDAHREFFYVTAYRDVTGSGGGLQDWGCGTKTYDGHRGTDLGVGGFAGMDAGRDVVAAAPGVVTYVNDGAFDRCTTADCAGGGGFGNYVRIEHDDGKVTYYAHLKKFSLTVGVGDTVTCGQKLGEVGSSGYSTGPHLHFEPRVSNVSDDPFSGPCGGSISWWVDQGEYLSLPATTCQDAPPAHALLSLESALDPIDGQAPDSHPDGDSAGVFDLESGQSVTARLSVTNAASAQIGRAIVVGITAPGGFVDVLDWEVLDNYPGNTCGGDWCPNDANDSPDNPPRQNPGASFELALNAMSPGETKMIVLTLRYAAPTNGAAPHAPVQMWVKQIEGAYSKATFDATPENVDDFQTFNGGDLAQVVLLDTWGTPGDGDPGDGDPGDGDPGDGSDDGGCSAGSSRSPIDFGPLMLVAMALLLRRRRRVR